MPTIVPFRRRLNLGAASAAGLGCTVLAARSANAQGTWPTKTIRFVVPFAPGGSSEIMARSAAAEMTKLLGQSVYVESHGPRSNPTDRTSHDINGDKQ